MSKAMLSQAMPSDVLSRKEFLSRYSGISSSTLNKLERQGLGPVIISRRPWRIRRADAEAWQQVQHQRMQAKQVAQRSDAATLALELSDLQETLRDINLTLNDVRGMSAQGLIHWQQDHLPRLQSKLRRSLQVPPRYPRSTAQPS